MRITFASVLSLNNDLFSTLTALWLGLKMSLFLTQAAMNFVLERQNGRKRSICIDLPLEPLPLQRANKKILCGYSTMNRKSLHSNILQMDRKSTRKKDKYLLA